MWARIVSDKVVEVTDTDPRGRYHPSALWVGCPTATRQGWLFDGEQCSPPSPEEIECLASRKRIEIDTARDQAYANGLPYRLADEDDVVQTRPQDQINLLGLSAKAQRLIAAGETDPVMPFRGKSNVTHLLTPVQMDELTLSALSHIEAIYQLSWQLKDAIERARLEQDRDALKLIHW